MLQTTAKKGFYSTYPATGLSPHIIACGLRFRLFYLACSKQKEKTNFFGVFWGFFKFFKSDHFLEINYLSLAQILTQTFLKINDLTRQEIRESEKQVLPTFSFYCLIMITACFVSNCLCEVKNFTCF